MARSTMVGMPSGLLAFLSRLSMYTRRRGWGWEPRALGRGMAWDLWVGVFQITWSTPGVLLPRLVVTRRTASALPKNERVSRCWRARTLPHLPAIVAFAIRCWRRFTSRSALSQSIWFQPCLRWGAAPGAPPDRVRRWGT